MDVARTEKSVLTPDGLTLWAQTFGSPLGQPVLLIMGAMNPGLLWPQAFCEHLARAGFFVIRYDHRDTGRSSVVDMASSPYTLTDMSADALAILDAYGVAEADLVGLSMGGYIAQLLAANQPERVRRLVLLSTTADHRPYMAATMGQDTRAFDLPPPEPAFLSYLTSASLQQPGHAEDTARWVLNGWRATHGGSQPFPEAEMSALLADAAKWSVDPAAAFHHAQAVAASPPRTALLAKIAAPTLVIHGLADPCLPLAHGLFLAAHIHEARLVTLDMGHMLPPPMSDTVATLIADFLHEA